MVLIRKPDFLIIGSGKCGTTTLADILASHPDCCFSRPKEVAFFNLEKNYQQGWPWYQKAFWHYKGENVIGEATPNYTSSEYSALSAGRIHQFNPAMKLIYIVRNPVHKMVSLWRMFWLENNLPPRQKKLSQELQRELYGSDNAFYCEMAAGGFERFYRVMEQRFSFLDNFKYSYLLEPYEKKFPEKQIQIFFLEDWMRDPDEQLRKLCCFLGLEYSRLPSFDRKGSNRTDSQKVDKAFFTILRSNIFLRQVVNNWPHGSRIRKFIRALGTRPAVLPPKVVVSDEYRNYIVHTLKNDAANFLKNNGKPENYWDLTAF